MMIGCAILAGGKSSRMGRDKALLEFDGTNFIKKISEELSGFEEKIIARGNASGIEQVDWAVVPDIYKEIGPIGGLHAVLSTCQSDAMFFVSCDMPLLQRNLVDYLCSFMDKETDAVISVSEDGRVHPLCGIYNKSVKDILEEQIQSGNYRMMALLDRLQVKYVKISSKEERQLSNINTPIDYIHLNKVTI